MSDKQSASPESQPRSKEEVEKLKMELRDRYGTPRPGKGFRTQISREVVEAWRQRQIDETEAAKRWEALVQQSREPNAGSEQTIEPAGGDGVAADVAPATPTGPLQNDAESNENTHTETPAVAAASESSSPETENCASTATDQDSPAEKPRPIQAVWKVLEPEDRSDEVPHEISRHEQRDDKWSLTSASVRGRLHAHRAKWREDAFAQDWVDDWTIIAVSDGAGTADLSRVGARIACEEAVGSLKSLLSGFHLQTKDADRPDDADLMRLKTFLTDAARKAKMGILREAQTRECSPRDLHATLLVVVHVPLQNKELVAAVQVGDGAVGVLTGKNECKLMGIADHGEYSSETRFLTTPHIENEFDQRVRFSIQEDIRCIGVMCDGVADDFFPEDKRLIELFNGDPIAEMKAADGGDLIGVMKSVLTSGDPEAALVDWLKYEKRASSDDRTLVLMHRSQRS
ncbi:MAG: PP2C family serine/threonine-protein phosphatase [Planctomycetaceae bacterium]